MQSPITVAIVLLAAGRATRTGGGFHKLLAEFDDVPLIRRMAGRAAAAGAQATVVVTGHRSVEVTACLAGLKIETVYNPSFTNGIASSIVVGVEVPSVAHADGFLIMLADMPSITATDLKRLIDTFKSIGGRGIVRATSNGKPGNPVILPRSLHDHILKLTGDVGARQIVETCRLTIVDTEIGDAAKLDVDTPDSIRAAGGILKR